MAMNLTRALCGRTISHQLNAIRSPISPLVRTVSMKIVAPPEHDKLSYDEKNALLKREMSPHLTIYKPQLTSMLSISHRFTARKKVLIFGGGGLAFIIILIIIIVVATRGSKKEDFQGSWVLDTVPLVDGHNDLPNNLYLVEQNILKDFDFSFLSNNSKWTNETHPVDSHTDLNRLHLGKVHGQFWSAYVLCNSTDPIGRTLEQIDVIKRLIAKYPDHLKLVTEHDGIMQAFWENKIGSLIGVEGGHSIDSKLSVLRLYYELGVRYMTLTHTCSTPWAESCGTDSTITVNGLTDFGKQVVAEMNRIGMIVDISHVSKKTMEDVLLAAKAPVIFSHSSAFHLTNNTRNVDDDILMQLKGNKGIIMVNFGSTFVRRSAEGNATMEDVIAHLDHIKNVTGSSEFIGIGADYDGVDELPEGLEDVSKYPALFDALAKYNETRETSWDAEDLKNLASRNLIRVMQTVEEFRDKSKDVPPVESVAS